MKRLWTIIGTRDVAHSLAWYQRLLGQPLAVPHHDYFGQLVDSDGTVLRCLRAWGRARSPFPRQPRCRHTRQRPALVFPHGRFQSGAATRALVDRLQEEPTRNPDTGTLEFALRDPDGYHVTINAAS